MTWAWAVVIPAFTALIAIGFFRERRRIQQQRALLRDKPGPDRRLRLSEIVGDRHDIGTWPGVPPLVPVQARPVVHQTPEHDKPLVAPCCGRNLADLPADEPFTYEPSERTCGGEA